jgi:hypothetical protein
MVQEILNDIDSDAVDSVDETVESEQVASIIKSTYYAMMSNRDWPHLRRTIKVNAIGDSEKPTHIKLQDGVKELCFINYNRQKAGETRKRYGSLEYLQPDHFLQKLNTRNNDSANIEVVIDFGGIELLIKNDAQPTYYTSFDDEYLVFDSYDSTTDDTIQQSKIQAQAYVMPEWDYVDTFVPDLPENAFAALVEEAKSRASFRLKQVADQKAEQEAGRQNRWLARKSRRVAGGIQYPNYGRAGRK